jgi:hypothetical protein
LRTTDKGKVYYVNHKEKTTQWHHPLDPTPRKKPKSRSSSSKRERKKKDDGSRSRNSGGLSDDPSSSAGAVRDAWGE